MQIAVVGGANVDIGGFSASNARMHDSNPGHVQMTPGGVGRNIAANLSLLGADVQLITALGGDARAEMLRNNCASLRIHLTHAITFPDAATSTYLYIANADGDMLIAVNDMDIHNRMTAEILLPALPALNNCDCVVLDANLPAETLSFLAENLRVPIVADAVSAAKVERLRDTLPHLTVFKPNRLEAEILTGCDICDTDSARMAAERLVEKGVKQVYLTLGEDGVCVADASGSAFLPCRARKMVNATGAGDAFTAAIAWALAQGKSQFETAYAGMAAASIAVESAGAVNMEMCREKLLARISENH